MPLALTFAGKGFKTTGFDIDPNKIDAIAAGESYISHIPGSLITSHVDQGVLAATSDFSILSEMAAIIICVPTPLGPHREPDLSYVISTAKTMAPHMRAAQLVVLESTTYPGTSAEILKPILESGGLTSGEEFFLAYSPERDDPGNADFPTASIPKVVGGDGDLARDLAIALYDQIVIETVPVATMEIAEAVKLTENIFRSVNIALVNELKLVYDKMGIDVWEVIEAAKTKPFGYMPFYPGPGLGGHCIPIDPFYLTWRAKQFGEETRFIELAGEINTAMPGRVVKVLAEALKERFGKSLNGARILLLGVAYKKNVNDTRESPGLKLMELLADAGASIDYYDPLVPEIPITREHGELAGRKSIEWQAVITDAHDAALICTDHDDVDYAALVGASKLVVDTRNATVGLSENNNIVVKA